MDPVREGKVSSPDPGEARLWLAYRRTGRTRYRNALVMRHEGWAGWRARSFARSRGLDWDDLRGAAILALIGAIKRFDPACGVPFRAFAARRVDGALFDAGRQALGRPSRRRARETPDDSCEEPRQERGAGGPVDAAADGPFSREPDPLDAAAEREIVSRLLDGMAGDGVEPARRPSVRTLREIARRRVILAESIDEIALAVGLGKSRVHELLNRELLPRARKVLGDMGILPHGEPPAPRPAAALPERTAS
jgi:RNA polymerase sigma factor (sigma-70 family)